MISLIFMLGIVLLFYFLMIKPRQRQQRQMQEMMSNLEVGDDVLTTAGIYGTIEEFDGGTLFLRISDNSVIKITRQSIVKLIEYAPEEAEADEIDEASMAEEFDEPKAIGESSEESDK